MLVTLLTPELGLVRARAEGVRRSGAKLAHALQTLHASDVILVRGKLRRRVWSGWCGVIRWTHDANSKRRALVLGGWTEDGPF